MSHVAKSDLCLPADLSVSQAVLKRLGCELMIGQTTWNWFGEFLNDWSDRTQAAALNGWKPEQFGHGAHAIRVPGTTYEVGLIPRRDGQPGFELLYDAWGDEGRRIEQVLGVGCGKLKDEVNCEVASRHYARQGYRVKRTVDANGHLKLTLSK